MVYELNNEIAYFKEILKRRGYFWDVSQLRNGFPYDQFFTPRAVKTLWQDFLCACRDRNVGRCVDLYIHIPFCVSKCRYCMYPSCIAKETRDIDRYLTYLIANMDFYAPVFKNFTFRNLYVGGGTPTILSQKQMKRLFSRLFKKFSFMPNSQRTIECNPHSSEEDKFALLKDFGFNRISFGVQSFNPCVLKLHKRSYQKHGKIKESILSAKKVGFKDINIDLIVGLAGDDPDRFRQSFLKAVMLEPHNIVVYGLMPIAGDYLSRYLKMGCYEYFMRYYPRLISQALKDMASLAHEFGYGQDSCDPYRWHWGFQRDDSTVKYDADTYSGEFGVCTLGLGFFSRSYIHERLEYRQTWQAGSFEPQSNLYEGRLFHPREAMIRFIINSVGNDSKIPLRTFRELFHCGCESVFPYAFHALKTLKKIRITGHDAHLLIKKPEDKYIYTLFFYR